MKISPSMKISVFGLIFVSSLAFGQASPPDSDPRNFEGIWAPQPGGFSLSGLPQIQMLPETRAIIDENNSKKDEHLHVATAQTSCRTEVGAMALFQLFSVKLVQDSDQLVIMLEEPRGFRQIFLGGGPPPAPATPSYRGYSVGHWEGNTLVVETSGSRGIGELDMDGLPYSEEMRISERFTKSEDGQFLNIEVTITDPTYYAAPFTLQRRWRWSPNLESAESDCSENPRGENDEGSFYRNDLYRPSCFRVAGEGDELSYIRCPYLE